MNSTKLAKMSSIGWPVICFVNDRYVVMMSKVVDVQGAGDD